MSFLIIVLLFIICILLIVLLTLKKELEKKEQNIKNSFFILIHEIKNPLAVCKGYIEMMNLNDINKSKNYIDIIESEINRSLEIMDNYKDITKVSVNKEIMDINLLIDEVLKLTCPLCKLNDVKLKTNVIDEEIYIYGDYEKLKQVLINIIKNSIESENNNENKIIVIDTKIIDDSYVISIKDNGKGLSKKELNMIEEPFYTTKINGTGLGVPFSKKVIKLHNGNIKYISKKNIGTTVNMSLKIIA